MEDRSIINSIIATLLCELLDFLSPLKWFFLLGLILILVDLRFGVAAAKYRGETIRFSRAIRRTANKVIDYLCWIFLAGAIGKAFGIPFDLPILPCLILLVIYGCEINSCYGNYFESKGKKVKVNVFKFFEKKTDIIKIEEE